MEASHWWWWKILECGLRKEKLYVFDVSGTRRNLVLVLSWLLDHENSTHTHSLVTYVFILSTYCYIYQASISSYCTRSRNRTWLPSTSYFIERGHPKTIRSRKQESYREKKTRYSSWLCRNEVHNKRSCRTANDSRILAQREDSDTEAEVEAEAEVIVVAVPKRRRGSRQRRRRE